MRGPALHRVLLSILMTGMFLIAMGPSQAEQSCQINIGYEPEPPYQYPDNKGQIIGIDADILNTVLAELGCSIKYWVTPWKRTLASIESGKLDATMGASFKTQRAKFAHYSPSYRGQPHVVFLSAQNSIEVQNIQEFLERGLHLGVVNGWHYTNKIRALLDRPRYKGQVTEIPNFENLPKMLATGRVDGFIANPSQLVNIVGKKPMKKDYRVIEGDMDRLHFLFSKKTVPPELAKRINDHLSAKFKNGFFNEVCSKYESQLNSGCQYLEPKQIK